MSSFQTYAVVTLAQSVVWFVSEKRGRSREENDSEKVLIAWLSPALPKLCQHKCLPDWLFCTIYLL